MKFFFQFHLLIFDWLEIELHDFFQIKCFRSNDSSHVFEKLTRVFFLNKSFIILFIFYQVVSISWFEQRVWQDIPICLDSNYRGYKFIMLTRVDQNQFLMIFFLPSFILLCLIGCKLRFIVCFFLKYFFPKLS